MDSVTQIVLGAGVAEAVAGHRMKGKAAFWGAIGGTLPDLDVFLRPFYDPIDAALVHRGFSHSLLFALLAGPILGWLFYRLTKKHDLKLWVLLWFLSIVTHPILDMFTNYGTQFLYPFDWRISWNTVFIIDPMYTLPFAFFLIGALFIRKDLKRRKKWNNRGLVFSTSYLALGVVIKLILLANATSTLASVKLPNNQTMVTPMPLTAVYWNYITQDKTNYYIAYKSLFGSMSSTEIDTIPKQHELLPKSGLPKEKQDLLKHITNGYYAVKQHGDSTWVYDIRFGTTSQFTNRENRNPIMSYSWVKTEHGPYFFRSQGRDFSKIDFGNFWKRVFGN